MAASAPASPRKSSGFKDRNDYLKYLEEERPHRGEAWYEQKRHEADEREKLRTEKRQVSDREWRLEIRQWGDNPAAIEQVAEGLNLGPYDKPARNNRRYKDVAGSNLLLNMNDGRFWFMDRAGLQSLRGKASGRGVINLVTAVKELEGEKSPYSAAKRFLVAISGIQPRDFSMTAEEMAKLKEKIAESSKALPPPVPRVETDIDPGKIPEPITDKATLSHLRHLVAEERGFPLDYVERMEREGTIFFGRPWRTNSSTKEKYLGKPVVASSVLGFETGKTVAISTRKIAKLEPHGKKGICEGQVAMGATVIGPWDADTKQVFVTEGVYDAGALRLMREREGTADPKDCYMILSGARVPDELVRICGERKIRMVAALDNDIAGRNMETHLREAAAKYGTEVDSLPIARGEVDVEFRDSTIGRDFYEKTIRMSRELAIPFAFKQPKDDFLRLAMPTTAASCKILEQIRSEFYRAMRAALPKKEQQQEENERDGDKDFGLDWHRKDWNELLKEPNYRQQVRTTAGLPLKDTSLRDAALERLTQGYGIDPAVADRLLAANVAYPIQSNTGPKLIWPTVGADSHPVGAMFEPMASDSPRRHVGQPGGLVSLAAKSPIAQEYIIADTLERGIEAWIKSGYTAAVEIAPDRRLSPVLKERIAATNLPVRVFAEDVASGTRFRDEVAGVAQNCGLGFDATMDRSPSATISVDARADKEDPEKEKRAEALAQKLHALAVQNQHKCEILRTRDGYIQVRSDNHRELINEISAIDEDGNGSIEPSEVKRRALESSRACRVVVEYHGRGVDRSEAAQSFRGSEVLAAAKTMGGDSTKPKSAEGIQSPEVAAPRGPDPALVTEIASAKKAIVRDGLDIDD